MSPDRAWPPPDPPEGGRRALQVLLLEHGALHRRRLMLTGAAVGLLVSATLRIGVDLGAYLILRPLARLDLLLAAFATLVALWALHGAYRAGARLTALQQEISALRVDLELVSDEPPVEEPPRSERVWVMSVGAAIAAAAVMITAAVRAAVGGASGEHDEAARRWTFLEPVSDPGALGFQTIVKRAGEWRVADHGEATGARALLNLAGAPGERPALAVVEGLSRRDLGAMTRCKFAPDHLEQACGIVFRYQHERAYYVVKADATSAAVTLGAVVDGVERELHRAAAHLRPSVWQELSVHARGERIVVAWNGQRMIDVRDRRLQGAGAVGLWVPAEGMAYFDELTVQPAVSSHDR